MAIKAFSARFTRKVNLFFKDARRRKAAAAVAIVAVLLATVYSGAAGAFAVKQSAKGRSWLAVPLAKASAKLTNLAKSYFQLGDVYLNLQDYEKAAESYQQVLLRDGSFRGAHYKRARALFVTGDFPRAISEATSALERDPSHVRAKYIRGLAYSYRADWVSAEKDFTDLLLVNQDWAWTRIDLSWVYLAQGKYGEAENILADTLVNHPGNAWALNNLGLARMHQGNLAGAGESFTQAMQAVDIMEPVQFLQAYPLRKPAQFALGQKQLKQGILFNLAVLYEKEENWAKARETYGQVLAQVKETGGGVGDSIRGITTEQLEKRIRLLAEKEQS